MKKTLVYGLIAAALCGTAMEASAQKFAIKAYDNITLNKPMNVTSELPGQPVKTSSNSFGVDFGWTFWRKGINSLEANIGVGYSFLGATFGYENMKYDYSAPTIADEDGNAYQRYYELTNLKQKSTVGYLTIPISLAYQVKPLKWLGIYAEAGVNLGCRIYNSIGNTSGNAYAYGIFPEYDDLLIDEPYLDDFGLVNLAGKSRNENKVKGFNCQIMCGAGFEFYAYKPVSFVVGVRYMAGLGNVFEGGRNGEINADNAPVTYTVADGTTVKSLADYSTKSKFAPLALHVGVNVRF